MNGICVITFSVNRPAALARCIRSVLSQQNVPPIRHCVFSERVDELRSSPPLRILKDRVIWHELEGEAHQGASSPRMARLRGKSLEQVKEPLVCFLDDDNEFFPNHLASLVHLIDALGLDAAHSWRLISNPDGTFFSGNYYPWHPDARTASRMYLWCVRHGVLTPGEAVMRDGRRGLGEPDCVATVDMNEWLFRTEILRGIGFDFSFSDEDVANCIGEDDKLFARVMETGLNFACTEMPTVHYRLGGVSNAPASNVTTR